jgi:NAD(P)-dependent dehydrogenase (short-subunit alcohol dehydrogenase family)
VSLSAERGAVIVTGASRGIGAAIAVALAGEGYTVHGLSRSGETPVGLGYRADVADEASLAAAIAAAAEGARIVGLVNNAGIAEESPSAELSAETFERVMRVNATAVVVASRLAYPHLKAAGGGLIINIGSILGKLGAKRAVPYAASKAAVGAITRCHAAEWAADGIRVLNVAPGYVATEFAGDFLEKDAVKRWLRTRIPGGEPAAAEEIGRFVAALFRADVPFLTGETIYIDGGHGITV